ncbi:MAG: hypothetical protein IPH65_14985 [Dehalococcoidia bacterium]|uniref:hypothetical protein n=1 Tax=Candidatus Amarobacter glycogenicus TaxID=3140699 RepID=UPI0031355C3D|nr:hypothetical protein [Dehalococcoidia bacterium]
MLESRVVATPLRLLSAAWYRTAGGRTAWIVSPEEPRDIKKKPVWVIGSGEATEVPR